MTTKTMEHRLPRRLRKTSYVRLYVHAGIFVLVTLLLLGAAAYGYLSLRAAAGTEYEKSLAKYDQSVAKAQSAYEKALAAYEEKIAAGEEAEAPALDLSSIAAPTMESGWEAARKNARNQTITRNFKKLSTWDKIKYTLQKDYITVLIVGLLAAALTAWLLRVLLKREQEKKDEAAGYLEALDFLLPFLFGLVLFTLYPIVNVVVLSFQEKYNNIYNTFSGYGLANYQNVLDDKRFINALSNTAQYVAFTVPISTVLALLIANLLNRKLRGSALFQTAYFLPMVTAATATGMAWKFMFHGEYGLINYLLSLFGISPINWLLNSNYNIWALIIYGIWNILPFTIILLLSGLQNIDDTYYTAARVDGAKGTRIFFRITVPLLAPTISLVLIINSISCAKVFGEVFPLFNGRPGVADNLYTMVYYIYNYAFSAGGSIDMGRAAAASIILFFILFAFTMLQLLIQRKWQYQ